MQTDEWWKRPQAPRTTIWDKLVAVWPVLMCLVMVASAWGVMKKDEDDLRVDIQTIMDTLAKLAVKMDGYESRISRLEQSNDDLKEGFKDFVTEEREWRKRH